MIRITMQTHRGKSSFLITKSDASKNNLPTEFEELFLKEEPFLLYIIECVTNILLYRYD